jgi:hypothetical protein
MEVNDEVYTKLQQHLEIFVEKWLNNQKETLLLQLIGFINDKKASLEHQIGSGKVQKLEKEECETE